MKITNSVHTDGSHFDMAQRCETQFNNCRIVPVCKPSISHFDTRHRGNKIIILLVSLTTQHVLLFLSLLFQLFVRAFESFKRLTPAQQFGRLCHWELRMRNDKKIPKVRCTFHCFSRSLALSLSCSPVASLYVCCILKLFAIGLCRCPCLLLIKSSEGNSQMHF